MSFADASVICKSLFRDRKAELSVLKYLLRLSIFDANFLAGHLGKVSALCAA